MGAQYIAIGDHNLALEEILRLPARLAPLALSIQEHQASVSVSIAPVAAPPPPLRESRLWMVDGLNGCSSLGVGLESFTIHMYDVKLGGFLTDLPLRAEAREAARAVAEVMGARRLVYCTDFNSDWDWSTIERGDRLDDVLGYLRNDQAQRQARWDETISEQDLWSLDFAPPFFIDELSR